MRTSILYLALPIIMAACSPAETAEELPTSDTDSRLRVQEILNTIPEVKIGELETRDVSQRINCVGRLEIPPSDFVSIHAMLSGAVQEIYFLPGDRVKKGERLCTISSRELVSSQRALAETHAELAQVELEYTRQKTLHDSEAISGRSFEEISARRKLLQARYEGLRAELELIGVPTAQVVATAKYVTQVVVRAPVAGYIHEVMINKGAMISSETPLIEMADDSHVHLELQVPGHYAELLALGLKVEFSVASRPERFEAEVIKMNHMLDERTGTIQAHCHISDEHLDELRVGMQAQATIMTKTKEFRGLPIEAVIKEGEAYYAYQVQGGLLERILLNGAKSDGDFVSFHEPDTGQYVTAGTYYLE